MSATPKTDSKTLAMALRILSRQIQSPDGIANAAIAEAADRIDEQAERIRLLTEAGDAMAKECHIIDLKHWTEAKHSHL